MKRRDFVTATAAIGAASLAAGSSNAVASPDNTPDRREFKLKYAPHFNMFKNSAGDDPIDQLKFSADQGFTAWEDNGMKNATLICNQKLPRRWNNLACRWESSWLMDRSEI